MPMVYVKSVEIFRHLMERKYHPKLVEVVMDTIHLIHEKGLGACCTSAYRPGDKGVHGTDPGRGFDLRTWDAPDEVWYDICETINSAWQYDPLRPHMKVAMYHDIGRGPHLHLQVHNATRKI
jgi:hypothetical protein